MVAIKRPRNDDVCSLGSSDGDVVLSAKSPSAPPAAKVPGGDSNGMKSPPSGSCSGAVGEKTEIASRSLPTDLPGPVVELVSHLHDPTWVKLLHKEFSKPYFSSLASFVKTERGQATVLPAPSEVFHAFNLTPWGKVKVVVLGQDPYPTPGHAHGLAFSVPHGVKLPGSLRNMYTLLAKQLSVPAPTHGNLTAWAQRGVLLLNVCLTVRAKEADSHSKKGWEAFTDAVVEAIASSHPSPVVFFLLGAKAKKKVALIEAAQRKGGGGGVAGASGGAVGGGGTAKGSGAKKGRGGGGVVVSAAGPGSILSAFGKAIKAEGGVVKGLETKGEGGEGGGKEPSGAGGAPSGDGGEVSVKVVGGALGSSGASGGDDGAKAEVGGAGGAGSAGGACGSGGCSGKPAPTYETFVDSDGVTKGRGVKHVIVNAPHPSPLSYKQFMASSAFHDLAAACKEVGFDLDLSLPPPPK